MKIKTDEDTDLNYALNFPNKEDHDNLKRAGENIKERFGLDQKGKPEQEEGGEK